MMVEGRGGVLDLRFEKEIFDRAGGGNVAIVLMTVWHNGGDGSMVVVAMAVWLL